MSEQAFKSSQSSVHEASALHVRGQAEYVDDRPPEARELLVSLITSPHARARIKLIDRSGLNALQGKVWVFDHTALAHKHWGIIFFDQPFLAIDEVFYVGEVVLVLAATDAKALRAARAALRIDYEVLPAVRGIPAARAAQSWIGSERTIARGDWQKALQAAPRQLQGTLRLDGAEHFYLENQVAIAYPRESGGIEVHASTQHPSETQQLVAEALGLSSKDVVCQTTRLGGGFGGKETQAAPIAVYAALVAQQTQRPARLVLSKDEDMQLTGKRNPFEIDYQVGFDEDGQILALDAALFSDGGAYADLSTAIMERAMTHADNAYYIPHVRIRGQVCRTHVHPHTAFRGFGAPKGVAMIELIMEKIAHAVGKDALDVRLSNCYRGPDRNRTPYGQEVEGETLTELFLQLSESSDYRRRRAELSEKRQASSSELYGMALTPIKFGISFITRFLNQGNALVLLHKDGSLQVSTGAVEMGQGVHTRIADLVARELGISPSDIRVMPTRTDKNANTSATAASTGTDINGSAALLAVGKIKERLARLYVALSTLAPEQWPSQTVGLGLREDLQLPEQLTEEIVFADGRVFARSRPESALSFKDLVREAYFNRVSLSEYSFYKIEGLDFNKVTGQGRAFHYFTQGVACSEVSVNRWTGEVKVLRSDILMDLGRPVNEALDLGQIRGAFVQGLGWMTTEHLVYDAEGKLLTHAPSTYKIPSIQDIPRVFQVALAPPKQIHTLHQGKAVGEPPLLLSFSVWAAIMDALSAEDAEGAFHELAIPATRERILRSLYPEVFARWEGGSVDRK